MNDPFNLQRFVNAQDPIYSQVLSELKKARKQTCWIWFVFPQIAGLGASWESRAYAISGLTEAGAYLAHTILGPRLTECSQLAVTAPSASAEDIFGGIDAMKFRSSMTLFSNVSDAPAIFHQALVKYFQGKPDALTLARI